MLNEYNFKIDSYNKDELERMAMEIESNPLIWGLFEDMIIQLFNSWANTAGGEVDKREIIAAECRAIQALKGMLSSIIDRIRIKEE